VTAADAVSATHCGELDRRATRIALPLSLSFAMQGGRALLKASHSNEWLPQLTSARLTCMDQTLCQGVCRHHGFCFS
jgi:hypothetical protein